MNHNDYRQRAITVAGALCLLAGCGATNPRTAPTSLSNAVAASSDLLYAADDGNIDVDVFSFRRGVRLGTLSGFAGSPEAVCSDRAGNVFVTVYAPGNNQIVEYAHGGTTPVQTLSAPGEPTGCSVDRTTGNLAVAIYSYSSAPASVAVYKGAQGAPKTYTDPDIPYMIDCAYDDEGNLFVSGSNARGFALGELSAGSGALQTITVKVKIDGSFFQHIGWDGRHVVISDYGDYSGLLLYRLRIAGGIAGVAGKSTFSLTRGNFSGDSAFWIQGSTIVIINQNFQRHVKSAAQVSYWKYPTGGTRTMWTRKVGSPYMSGVTVSLGSHE
jgi:hypothetical protein